MRQTVITLTALVDIDRVELSSRGALRAAFHNAKYPYKVVFVADYQPRLPRPIGAEHTPYPIRIGGEGWIRTSAASQVTCAPKLDCKLSFRVASSCK